ncbi:hypothetical protein F66182_989 [Fusarium sp. NRRL 66182]|nr:hypothetical protein F66182_989 [Fusarium sp. NRRL 66182]
MGDIESFNLASDQVLHELTAAEKISLLSGVDFWHTHSIPRLSIPKLRMSDGPNGVRGTKFFDSVPAACLPCGTALAASWSVSLMGDAGELIAQECHAKSAHVWLGPTTNIQRSPLGGRGFESFSEDPFLGGSLAAAIIKAVQRDGVACALKHFVANDMEHERTLVDCLISPRALREIYLLPFQLAIRDSNPWALMTSYNRVNGVHMSENCDILQGIVREEWSYDGCIISDWFGTYSTVAAINNGLDLEMPGPAEQRGRKLTTALGVGKIRQETIDARASSFLKLVDRVKHHGIVESGPEAQVDTEWSRQVLRKLATESIVLLKNDNGLLPFKTDKKTVVIGSNIRKSFYCGGGSASLRPTHVVSILEAIQSQCTQPAESAEAGQIYNQLPVLGDLITAPDGSKGRFQINFYAEPPHAAQAIRQPIQTLLLDDTNIVLYDYSHPAVPDNVLYATVTAELVVPHTDTYALSLTVAGTATLFLDDVMVVDNSHDQERGESFFGSGSKERIGHTQLTAGKTYQLRVEFGSANTSNLNRAGAPVFGAGGVRIGCARCHDESLELDYAVELAKTADQVLLCVGLGPEWESEGSDRDAYALPGRQCELISRIASVNTNTAVIIQSGTPVLGPWDEVGAVIQSWYGGNELGHAIADIVMGKENPSGKLPVSWPKRIEDNPAFLSFRSEAGRCLYSEDIYVGYRFYEKTKKEVQWPFGFGLSYSSFDLQWLDVQLDSYNINSHITITASIRNTSPSTSGYEVIQAYISRASKSVFSRPPKELKGFTKVFIPSGETKEASIRIPLKYATSIWDERNDSWLMESGAYTVFVGNSSDFTPISAGFRLPLTQRWRGL